MDDTVQGTQRRQALGQMPPLEQILRGSVVIVKRHCGKPSCRCLKGYKHRALYVSQSQKGKPRLVYIPQRSEKEVRMLIKNYRKMKAVVERISQINLERVTATRRKKK